MEKKLVLFLTTLLTFGFSQDRTEYTVDGNVFLEDSLASGGSHEGVQITFYNLPGMEPEDSTYSDSNGYYNIDVNPGYYLVIWTKDGYVPWELGGLALAADTTLADVTLIPGAVQEVSGDVSGNWTTGYVYWVMGDITVPCR